MIYLDYSATTPIHPEVLKYYVEISKKFFANPNSLHDLGQGANNKIVEASSRICNIFHTVDHEVIYTSGASEANNLAIKGVALKKQNLGKHIITSPYEHSSVVACFNYLSKNGFEVDVVKTNSFGLVDFENLASLIRDDTILVSIGMVNSEIGFKQPIEEIGVFLKKYPQITFHSDMTQAIGKIKVDITNVDLISFSAHKFYGLKGVGALLRKKTIELEPVIHGGRSTTNVRSGTPATPLLLSLEKALSLACDSIDLNYEHVKRLSEYLINELLQIESVTINSNKYSIPHILNLSVEKLEAHQLQTALAKKEIYVSTQSACNSSNAYSHSVFRLTGSESRAKSSIRISISSLTTLNEMNQLVEAIKEEVSK
ncbi:MAG: cysteine desulfurase [Firmicutes bacterium]|nr:cysteine desulfurase [Bacillota bacterium]